MEPIFLNTPAQRFYIPIFAPARNTNVYSCCKDDGCYSVRHLNMKTADGPKFRTCCFSSTFNDFHSKTSMKSMSMFSLYACRNKLTIQKFISLNFFMMHSNLPHIFALFSTVAHRCQALFLNYQSA